LIGCASPGIVSTDADGRVRVSFVNDRDDQLPVKCVGGPLVGRAPEAARRLRVVSRRPSKTASQLLAPRPRDAQFRISHDFTVTRAGQKSVHSFVRKGSVVSPDAKMIDLDTGKELATHSVSGKDVNALGYYPEKSDPSRW